MAAREAYASKAEARQAVWDTLTQAHAACFPFPPRGRIPNFVGAREAAERLLAHPLFAREPSRLTRTPRSVHVREGAMIETDRSWGSVGNAPTSCSACTVVAPVRAPRRRR